MPEPIHANHPAKSEQDYILGTNDVEVTRLGIQHDAWRGVAQAAWKRAGIAEGTRVIDVGAGPGFAALDLAELVGPQGHVTAVERSTRFIEAGRAMARDRGVNNIDFAALDLMRDELPADAYDAAWCRWVASFVESPALLVSKVASTVREGGVAVFHEYGEYASWRFSPSLPLVEAYVERVMESWRDAGGEPDVAWSLPPELAGNGFEVVHATPRVYCVKAGTPYWTWISTFLESNVTRMIELDACESAWGSAVLEEFRSAEQDPNTLMLTPLVMEIVARRMGSGE